MYFLPMNFYLSAFSAIRTALSLIIYLFRFIFIDFSFILFGNYVDKLLSAELKYLP